MMMNRDQKQKRSRRCNARFFVFGLSAAIFIFLTATTGCVQKTAYTPPDAWPREVGSVTTGTYRGLAVADLDQDGYPDVVGGSSEPGTVAIWYGMGHGKLSAPLFLPVRGDVQSVATADFNNDGFLDVVFSIQREASGIMVWMGQPDRQWIKGRSPKENGNYNGVAAADINGDGHIDILAANGTSVEDGGVQIWLGDGHGDWFLETGPTYRGIFMDVAVADFNQDGIPDVAASGWGTHGAVRVWLGLGAGNWSSVPALDLGSFYGLTTVDLDQNGTLDLLACTYRKGVRVYLGDGQGGFARSWGPEESLLYRSGFGNWQKGVDGRPKEAPELRDYWKVVDSDLESSETPMGSYWKALALDLDGDQVLDIVAGSIEAKGILAWRNAGKEGWEPLPGKFPATGNYYGMVMADVNKDGSGDVLAASYSEGVKVWLGESGDKDDSAPSGRMTVSDVVPPKVSAKIEENRVYTTIRGFPEYKIGPGDELEITIWKGSVPERAVMTVRQDGKISYHFLDDIDVTGKTAHQLDVEITEKLKAYVNAPRVDVLVKAYQSKYVNLMGAGAYWGSDSAKRGRQYLDGKMTVLELVSASGGMGRDANLRDVRFQRKNGQAFTLNLFKAIAQGDMSQNVILDDRDFIYIPMLSQEGSRVYVFGEVRNPGAFAFSGSKMMLMDAISEAGGTTVFASAASTKVVRGDRTNPEVLSSDFKRLMEEGDQTQNIALKNGDLVYVPRSFVGDINLFVKRIQPILDLFSDSTTFIQEFPSGENRRFP